MTNFDEVRADFKSKFDLDMTRRIEKAGLLLVQELRDAVKRTTKVSSGSQGSLGSIQSLAKLEANLVKLQIGLGPANEYLKYRLWGVSPAPNAYWAGFNKMPPPDKMPAWAKKSGLPPPAWAKMQAAVNAKRAQSPHKHPQFDKKKDAPWNSSDPFRVWGFRIAQNKKKFGITPLKHYAGGKLIETVLQLQTAKVKSILAGEV